MMGKTWKRDQSEMKPPFLFQFQLKKAIPPVPLYCFYDWLIRIDVMLFEITGVVVGLGTFEFNKSSNAC